MPKWPWVERTFRFDFPVTKFPDILERLRGTPARLEEALCGLTTDVLTRRDEEGWSAQENAGHLLDLEEIWFRRVAELIVGVSVLCAADMTNQKTHAANHNARDIRDLLSAFRKARTTLVVRHEALDEAEWGKTALHPRLKQPLRVVDLACFVAEHDDYHLARIHELTRTRT